MNKKPGAFFFADVVNPTADELRAWAYADTDLPFEDFEMVLDSADVLPAVVECASDTNCPTKTFLLRSLYCSVGHSTMEDRPRLRATADAALASSDAAVRTWGRRSIRVIDGTDTLVRDEWCGWPSLAVTKPIEV